MPPLSPIHRRVAAYYWATVENFLQSNPTGVVGELTLATQGRLEPSQRDAWVQEIAILREALNGLSGSIGLEFSIPRVGRRIDAVVLLGSAVFSIEFKVGSSEFRRADINQAWDYALDLKYFHKGSHQAQIFPILVATEAQESPKESWSQPSTDGVRQPYCCAAYDLGSALRSGLSLHDPGILDHALWVRAPYEPTPTIIEAARALYANHSVVDITRNDAGTINLGITSATVESIIEMSQSRGEKAIVFVTGVPGSGKTLVGLNVATNRREKDEARAVFLSGNGPLVKVLQTALARDEKARSVQNGSVASDRKSITSFIQIVHHFRDDGIGSPDAPSERVVIFDEAQRAWDLSQTVDFMKRKKRQSDFNQSESQFLISCMDRHKGWAVVICLVGGGQEINKGEAGIAAWLDAVREHFPHWRVYVSPELRGSEHSASEVLGELDKRGAVTFTQELHLASSVRSFRSEHVAEFVRTLLLLDRGGAGDAVARVTSSYPMVLTRDLALAKAWVRSRARGTERVGLVCSSQASRLKPHAIDVRAKVDPVHYFLGDADDTRSSNYLEDAATEFQIQGLELDWVCLTWDADFRLVGGEWQHRRFVGKDWQTIHKENRKRYTTNSYRVLLTRARQGMVIFVPPGDASDPTRDPTLYDETYEYLRSTGLRELPTLAGVVL